MTNFKKTTMAIVTSGLLGGLGSVHAGQDVPVFEFPDPSTFAVLYDDFYSFSLPILSSASTGFTSTQFGTNSPYYINTANVIQNALVIGTGAGGNQDNSDLNLTGFYQDAYDFPNVLGQGVAVFSTTDPSTYATTPPAYNDTNPTSNSATTWDISLQALRDYLTIDGQLYDLVAYFNNNQQKDDGPDLFGDNNLWAYAEVTLVDSETGATKTLYFRDPTDQYYAIMDYADDNLMNNSYVDPFGHGQYVLAGGTVTLCFNYNNGTNNTAGSTVTDCAGTFDWSEEFEHNLGQNAVAYGITSLELNDIIHDLGSVYDLMQVRVDFDQLNNGFENLYIGAACVNCGFEVPEPNALALAALGLLGLGLVARRRRQS